MGSGLRWGVVESYAIIEAGVPRTPLKTAGRHEGDLRGDPSDYQGLRPY